MFQFLYPLPNRNFNSLLLMPNLEWIIFTEVNYENSLHPSRKDADSFQLKSLSRERSLSTADTYTSTSMQVCKFVSSLSF